MEAFTFIHICVDSSQIIVLPVNVMHSNTLYMYMSIQHNY